MKLACRYLIWLLLQCLVLVKYQRLSLILVISLFSFCFLNTFCLFSVYCMLTLWLVVWNQFFVESCANIFFYWWSLVIFKIFCFEEELWWCAQVFIDLRCFEFLLSLSLSSMSLFYVTLRRHWPVMICFYFASFELLLIFMLLDFVVV